MEYERLEKQYKQMKSNDEAKIYNAALEEAAQLIEVVSLGDEFGSCFNQNKPGCAAILADAIRALKRANKRLQSDASPVESFEK